MYTGGLKTEKLNVLYTANKLVKIAVKTPQGKSESKDIKNVVIQEDVFGPMMCSKQVDLFEKECLEEQKYLYKINKVPTPPLMTVDDVLCISECGYKTAMVNSYLKCELTSKNCNLE